MPGSDTRSPAPRADLPDLPDNVRGVLEDFLSAAKAAFGPALRAAVLFGSAAEGRLRRSSDVNLILVLESFERAAADALREPLRTARAAIGLQAMFLREDELPAALESFALKFADVLRRRRVLLGDDPFADAAVPAGALRFQLRQVLLNLELRLRAAYVERGLREEQLARLLAEEAGPLRAAAAALLELEGGEPLAPKAALARLAGECGDFGSLLDGLSRAREEGRLEPGEGAALCFRLLELVEALDARVARLGAGAP